MEKWLQNLACALLFSFSVLCVGAPLATAQTNSALTTLQPSEPAPAVTADTVDFSDAEFEQADQAATGEARGGEVIIVGGLVVFLVLLLLLILILDVLV